MFTTQAFSSIFLAGALLLAGMAGAEELPPSEPLLSGRYVEQVTPQSTTKAVVAVTDVPDQSFPKAMKVTNLQRMDTFYAFQTWVGTCKPVAKGDVVLVRFWARGSAPKNEDGEAEVQVYFQQTRPKWFKDMSVRAATGPEWKRFDYPFVVSRAFPAGAAALYFGFGFNEQTIEIGGVQVLRFGRDVKLRDLPRTPIEYPGSAADAPWRAEAAKRIEQHRKADLSIRVVDQQGAPVPDAEITVAMTKHAFQFSSVVNCGFIERGGADVERYKQKVLELFNASGNENALKWPAWDGHWGRSHTREGTLSVFKWMKDNGLHARGHVMLWPSWKRTPKTLKALQDSPEELRRAIRDHIVDIATKTKPYIDEWDVINETRTNHDLMDVLGRDAMVEWFKTAHGVLPDTPLFINDFGILGTDPGHPNQTTYKETIRYLLDQGAPVSGIGLQSHIGSKPPHPANVVKILDDFAQFGLALRITEFDINITDEDTQARFTRDFMTAVFSHPSVVGFQMWGFWAGRHWKPAGAMYRKNWEEKPNAAAYKKLVFSDWWTRETCRTDANGCAGARGFLGNYDVTVSHAGKSKTVKTTLKRNCGPVTIVLE